MVVVYEMKYCGRPCHDQDYCVCGLTKEMFEQIFPMARKRGKSFGVYEIDQQEYALARREHKCAEGHRGFTVQTDPSISIEEDLARRDLTVNAIAKDLETNTYLDPYGGREDLKHGVLRAIGSSYAEDPLRVYRVARLAATLSFTVEPETLQMMQKLKPELKSLSKERVMTEFQKALLSPSPRIFFDVLKTAQVLDVHFPEIQALVGVPQPEQYHPEGDAYQHTMLALQSTVSLTQQPEIRYAVLVHDFGKGKTPPKEYPHHIDHEKKGVEEVEKLSQRLGVPKRWKKCGEMAALFHGKAGIFSQMRVAKQVDFLDMLSRSTLGLDGMEIVVQADQMGKKQGKREINLAHVGHQMLEQVKGKTIAQEHLDWPDTKRKEKIREERIRWLSAYAASQRRENPMNRKSEKGSIVVYVLVTMVIFTIICIGVFVRSTSKQQLQLETLGRLQNVYQGDQTAQEAYQQYVGGDVIPIYTADQFYQIASGSTLNIQDKNYTMSKGKTYYLQQDIVIDKDVSSILKMAQNHEIEIIGQGHMVSSTVNGTTYVYLEENQWEKESPFTTAQSGVGYYADTDRDGTVDGVIFADKAVGNQGSGKWNDSDGVYTIPKVTEGLKDYSISQKSYTGKFGTKPVISPTGTGEERFYIMALTDIDGKTNGTSGTSYDWYHAAYDKGISEWSTITSEEFGTGKTNTATMIAKWNATAYGAQDTCSDHKDMWGQIQTKVKDGWFVPSRAEWAAFAGELGITSSNYGNFGLSYYYWSSSLFTTNTAWSATFGNGYLYYYINYNLSVRLGATF